MDGSSKPHQPSPCSHRSGEPAESLFAGLICVALLCTVHPAHAQDVDDNGDGGPPAQSQVRGTGQVNGPPTTLHGIVVNAVTHQPIARTLVSLEQYSQSMLTDNEGRFTFEGVPDGGVTMLTARRPGYAGEDTSNIVRQTVSTRSTAEIALELVPQSAITGELLLPGDDPPEQLQIQLLQQVVQDGRAHWSIIRSTDTNSEGHFRFGGLPAGAYLLHAGASLDPIPAQPPPGSPNLRSGYVPIFYPAAREIAAAGVLTLSAGGQASVKMELTREPYYPVAISVDNPEDARGVGFEISSDSFLGLPARFSPGDGMVHSDLPAGHYLLEAQGYDRRALSGRREFDVNSAGARTAIGAITLLPASRIPVTVHPELSHTATVPGAGATLTAARQISLTLQRQGEGVATRGRQPSLEDGPDSETTGASQIVGAAPGKYWVNASAYGGYIASMTSGGVDLLQEPLTVAVDGSAASIDVTLRDDWGTLAVTFGSSLQTSLQSANRSLYLQLIPQSGAAIERSAGMDGSGATTLNSLAPGTYLAFASTVHRNLEYRNPTAMAAIASRGQTVHIEPGGTAHITIDSLGDSLATPGNAP